MDHYRLLGIRKTASKDDIKKAYHRLALKYHPDKNKASNAEEKFRSLNEAYKVLRDDHKREAYDRFDLPEFRSNSKYHPGRHRHDEKFFRGSSETFSKEQKYQAELERIRSINSDLLDKAIAEIRRGSSEQAGTGSNTKRTGSRVFVGDILPEENDDDYEKIVLDRLRACGSNTWSV